MKNFQRDLERFFIRNRDRGIPDLMLYIAIANAIVYVFSLFDPSNLLYGLFRFDRSAILSGQLWRLVTFLAVPELGSGIFGGLLSLLMLFVYFRIGRLLEGSIGRCKFDLFYLSGVILLDILGLLTGYPFRGSDLNFTLLLVFATLYPESTALLFGIIPLKMKYLGWFYWGMIAVDAIVLRSLLPLVPLLPYVLFFWSDIPGLLPIFKKIRISKRPRGPQMYRGNTAAQKAYRHKCTVCGRTDTEYPHLEFRYCSKCSGYHCYCLDHINNHAHIPG